MARPPSIHPTDGELEILRVLWSAEALSLGELCNALRARREVATTTVATMLRVMSDKGLVKRTGSGRTAAWSAAVSQQRTERGMTRSLLDRVFDGAADRMVAHLVEGGQLTADQLADLRRLIDEQSTAPKRRKKKGPSS